MFNRNKKFQLNRLSQQIIVALLFQLINVILLSSFYFQCSYLLLIFFIRLKSRKKKYKNKVKNGFKKIKIFCKVNENSQISFDNVQYLTEKYVI